MTSPLLARAETALTRLANVTAVKQDAADKLTIERALHRINQTIEQMTSILDTASRLAKLEIPTPRVSAKRKPAVVRARTQMRSVATAIVGMPSKDVAARLSTESMDKSIKEAEEVANSLRAALIGEVSALRARLRPADIDAPVFAVSGVPDSLIVKLGGIQRRLTADARTNIPIEDLSQLVAQIRQDTSAWVEQYPLLREAISRQNPEIQSFVTLAMSSDGAPWSAVTANVMSWLESTGTADRVTVVLKP